MKFQILVDLDHDLRVEAGWDPYLDESTEF